MAVAEAEDPSFVPPAFPETYQEPSPLRMGVESLDLSQIVPRPWALSLPQLPALLERGPAVEQFA